jgi:hypothetical protein
MRNLEEMDVQEVLSAETRMQIWDKEQTPETATTKQEGIQKNLHENHWTGDHKVNCHVFCWVTNNEGLDLERGGGGVDLL